MGKRIIISESEKKNILSLYETNTATPPPSESVLIVNKNPFKYSEYESARQTYSSNLKDGDMFYMLDNFNFEFYKNNLIEGFSINFLNGLNNKTVRDIGNGYDDIITFYGPLELENRHSLSNSLWNLGNMKLKYNDGVPKKGEVYLNFKSELSDNNFELRFNNKSFNKINELFNKQYKESVVPKLKKENIPDEYFEIRKIQRQQTDF